MTVEERSQRVRGVVRTIALHRVARALDAYPLAAQRARELRRVLVEEDLALATADDERRAVDRAGRLPERLHAGQDVLGATFEDPAVVLPGPLAVGRAPERVLKAASEVLAVSQRIEGGGAIDELLEGVGLGVRGHEVPKALAAPHLRSAVDEDEGGERPRVPAGVGERDQAAERHAHEDEVTHPQLADNVFEIGDVRIERVTAIGRPFAVAVTPQIERERAHAVAQLVADDVPGVRGETAAVEEERIGARVTVPVEEMQAHAGALDRAVGRPGAELVEG